MMSQGKCAGRVGYFPSTYVMRLHPGERAMQVTSGVEVTEVNSRAPVTLLKDQVRESISCLGKLSLKAHKLVCKVGCEKDAGST